MGKDDAKLSLKSFGVLFYKRKNKVHKSKGVSKFDGKLVVQPHPSSVVKLFDDDNSSKPIYNRITPEVSKRVFGEVGLDIDDTVAVGQYEVQIVSIVDEKKKVGAEPKQPQVGAKLAPLRRKPFIPLRSETHQQRITPRKQFVAPTRRPLVPKTAAKAEDSDEDSTDEENRPAKTPTVTGRKRPFQSPLISNRKKQIVVVTKKTRKSAAASTSTTVSPATDFPGAVGNLTVPASIRHALRPHQETGIAFLWNCLTGLSSDFRHVATNAGVNADECRGAILADEMGLGKTLMTIATIFALHRQSKENRFIVVCPSSLVSNWAKEFDKWIGRASQPKRVVVTKGGEEALKLLRAFVMLKPKQSEVLILSYDMFRLNVSILSAAQRIGLLVVDEGHKLKNTAGSRTIDALNSLVAEARLLITGTPIQNNLSEFYTVANFVCPGLLGDLTKFRREFERPINAANNRGARWDQKRQGQAQSQALEAITKTFMLRRLQKDVLKALLPPRKEFLLFCRPSPEQCRLYRNLTNRLDDRVSCAMSPDALVVLTQLRKLCCHPQLVESSLDNEQELSGKLTILHELLLSIRSMAPKDKVVIVSNFTTALTLIEEIVLNPNGITYCRLDGSTELGNRQSIVDSFNRSSSDKCFVFLLSSRSGGCGLNLVGANRLVMFDGDFNPATDMQAMARVYRQGQTKKCYIYRLFTSGTVEEVIYQRQQVKGNLVTITVDGESCTKQNSGFTKEELRDCFTLKDSTRCDTKEKVGQRWPSYEGPQSLLQWNSDDPSLFRVAESQQHILRYIHLVDDKEAAADQDSDDPDMSEMESLSSYCSESDEENEFNE